MPDTTEYEYTVTFRAPGRNVKTIRATDVRTSDNRPDLYEFTGNDGKPVAFIAREEVLSVERRLRADPSLGTEGLTGRWPCGCKVDTPAGFKPTSQIVTRGGEFSVTAE